MSQHVVVIGGTKGLGLAMARALVDRGDRVTVVGRHADHGARAARGLGRTAAFASADLTDWDSLDALFAGLPEDRSTVDHLVLAALDRDHNDIRDFRPDDSARTSLMKNVGYAAAVHSALPNLADSGSVLLFSGLSMWLPFPGSTTISMANAGVVGLCNSLATQIAPVRVNVITPGVVSGTAAVDHADPVRAAAYEKARQRTPGKRLPTTDDIVGASLALLDNHGINGANLVVDAGMHLV